MQGSRGGLRRESSRRDGELKGSGRDVRQGELPIAAGEPIRDRTTIFAAEFYLSPGDYRSTRIHHRSADAARGLRTGNLLSRRRGCALLSAGRTGLSTGLRTLSHAGRATQRDGCQNDQAGGELEGHESLHSILSHRSAPNHRWGTSSAYLDAE